MSEPIRLWGCADDPYFVRSEPSPYGEGYHQYAALPRAEYDALVSRAEKPLDHVMRTSCGHEWTVRHTSCSTCFAALVKERDEATLGANEMREEAEDAVTSAERYMIERDAATARAEKAEAQRDAMNAQYESAMEVIHRNAGARRDGLCGILAWIDRAKEVEALLREARFALWALANQTAAPLVTRIDAHLEKPC